MFIFFYIKNTFRIFYVYIHTLTHKMNGKHLCLKKKLVPQPTIDKKNNRDVDYEKKKKHIPHTATCSHKT